MSTVYIFEKGELHEGGEVLGVYNNEMSALWELAIAFNKMYDRYKDWRPGTTDNEDMMPYWNHSGTYFDSGCDYWTVHSRELLA
jgi:hypothetical protein